MIDIATVSYYHFSKNILKLFFHYLYNEFWVNNLLNLNLSLFMQDMSRLMGKPTMWFLTKSGTNQPVQSQKQARNLKFWIKEEEGLYYPCSENKGADQLRGYREADLCLCFRICKLLVFS